MLAKHGARFLAKSNRRVHADGVDRALLLKQTFASEPRLDAKDLGAYYTDDAVARFLTRWAVRSGKDVVLDPSAGGGVFLIAAHQRLRDLKARSVPSVHGVEIDERTHAVTSTLLGTEFRMPPDHLKRADFFAIEPCELPAMTAVVGNPPFIRYQRFAGADRDRALRRAAAQGVDLSKLASSWAPFVVHSTAFLAPGGRLAMVLPQELGHASYARPVLTFLAKNFAHLHLVTFQRALFPHLNEDTLLLLAEGRRNPDGRLSEATLHDLAGPQALESFTPTEQSGVNLNGFLRGQHRLTEFFLSESVRSLYTHVRAIGLAQTIGKFADIGIGYVSGRNDFFHPPAEAVRQYRIPARYLRRAVLRGSALRGLEFTDDDWRQASTRGDAGHLLKLSGTAALPDAVRSYLASGETDNVHLAYKCRVRPVWYAVPHVYESDGFLTYMNGSQTRLVANAASAVAPNTLHLVRLHPQSRLGIYDLAARWLSSLTQLSVEIEGHALGGGMLKLEPKEAESVLLPCGQQAEVLRPETAQEFDIRLRSGETAKARGLADELYLHNELGLSLRECDLLHNASLALRNRRMQRKQEATP